MKLNRLQDIRRRIEAIQWPLGQRRQKEAHRQAER